MTSLVSLGIDVSKQHLDWASESRNYKRYDNSPAGIRALVERITALQPFRITVESTGIYSLAICEACAEAGLPIFLAHPGRVRKYADSQGFLAKSDAIDARVIAEFGRTSKKIRPFIGPSAEQKRLRAMVTRRDQLTEDRVREEGRLEACCDSVVAQELRRSIKRLNKNIAVWEQRIDAAIKENDALAAKQAALQSVTGVAAVTSSVLLVHVPELGQLNRQELAAIAGVAPYNRDSGNHQGKRAIYGGRERVRKALFMAARTAVQPKNKSPLCEVYKRLIAKGKPFKVAIIAVARRLLAHLNSLIKDLIQKQAIVSLQPQ